MYELMKKSLVTHTLRKVLRAQKAKEQAAPV